MTTALPANETASHRAELTAYCRRMLGSAFDAEDAVQETLLRAWRGSDGFEGRAPLRTWLYRIATNVCFDAIRRSALGAVPVDEWPELAADCPDADPAERAISRENLRLALIAAMQTLPPRQRAVLLLHHVLCWRAAEVAELLGTTVAAVNSALQRARATLGGTDLERLPPITDGPHRDLLARYLAAFDADDMDALISLTLGELR
jgi:RNA polymerase sigma-70 factor, ECF subfamily